MAITALTRTSNFFNFTNLYSCIYKFHLLIIALKSRVLFVFETLQILMVGLYFTNNTLSVLGFKNNNDYIIQFSEG